MTADTLRAAADRLRTLAQATDGEWYSAAAWATASPMSLPIDPADAALIAAMSPPVALAVADWLDDIATRHAPDPDPADLVLHYEKECPTGECEDPGYHAGCIVCAGCYPAWEGMDGHSLYPCVEIKAALAVAEAIGGGA